MKIAAVSEDGVKISQHFGRAPYYVVVTVEGKNIVESETRPKETGHHGSAAHAQPSLDPGQRHGCDAGSQPKHRRMAETIADCDVLIAGGMGWGAYESLKGYGIRPIVTDVAVIREAVLRYIDGNLPDLRERLH